MNAPASAPALVPRPVPQAFRAELRARCGEHCSIAERVRENYGTVSAGALAHRIAKLERHGKLEQVSRGMYKRPRRRVA